MATIEQLKKTGQDIYPVTTPEAVRDSQGTNLDVILAGKQPTISDLASIRSGAAKGNTALQTKTDVEGVLTGEISTHTHPHDTTKQNVIDSTHKLSSDLVDDTNHTNKFVTADSVKDVLPSATQSLTTESKASVRNNLDTPANMYNTAPAASASAYEIPYDTMYALGTLTGAITLTLASITAGDTLLHVYAFTFTADTTAPTITWPAGISWQGGSAPTITAGKSYELSILNNKALISEY